MSDVITVVISDEKIDAFGVVADETITVQMFDGSPALEGHEIILAAQIMAAYKVIVPNGAGGFIYASNAVDAHRNLVYGITLESIGSGLSGRAQISGIAENSTWNWDTSKPLFLGVDGELTQTPPSTGFILVVARPITATKVNIRIESPIKL